MNDRRSAEPRRKYHSPIRTAAAASTRERILEAAAASFAEGGYAPTTLKQIAERADVSVQSVHLAGPKPVLLIAAFRNQVESVALPPEVLDASREQLLDRVVDFAVALGARTAHLWRALDEASRSEPLVQAEYRELLEKTDAPLADALAALDVSGPRRDDVFEELRFALSPAAYLHFVDHEGWDLERYRARSRRVAATLVASA